ncbi:hypothetical protein M3Y98_00529400 [Aphelenchoides besseyi]|nr:hypothetical protein M3Y98_00529400 [Aphelenchoides besseyi]
MEKQNTRPGLRILLLAEMQEDERVSLFEIFEVRASGFSSAELLAIIYSTCDYLLSIQERGLFSSSSVYISYHGKIKIEFLNDVPFEFLPPEIQSTPTTKIVDSQVVWVLGEVVRGLISHVETRPTIQYLRQIAKNRIANPESVPNMLLTLYQEVMGDVEALADDSDTESMITTNDNRQPKFGTKVAQMTRASTSVSSTPAGSTTSPGELQSLSSSLDEESLVDIKETTDDVFMIEPIPEIVTQATIVDDASSLSLSRISEESALPRSPDSPMDGVIGSSTTATAEPSENIRFMDEMVVEKKETKNETIMILPPVAQTKRPSRPPATDITHEFYNNSQTNKEPVEVEIHHESSRPASPVNNRVRYERNKPKDPAIFHHQHAIDEVRRPSKELPTVPIHSTVNQSPISARKPHESPALSRHNSLQSSQIRRRSTARRMPRKPVAVPEFIEKRNLPLIRLRAQSQKRKRVTLHRIENTLVLVKLVNGQTVELNCRSDVLVANIFDTVVSHLNISEHSFFGLAIFKNNEFFFLENDHRLEKFAPPGWKYVLRNGNSVNFILFLRFKFYPKRTEFIRTEVTMHELYLQLRQDIINRSLIGNRQQAFEAAAIALQAEYGDYQLGTVEYFDINNYLPSSLLLESGGMQEARQELIRRHQNMNGYKTERCERMFIRLCQTMHSFGAHFYVVHKFKPSTKGDERNARFQDLQTVAIMPHGLGICKDTASRNINVTYEWHFIRTLQYDGRRFLIATIENNVAMDHVFYTDHFTKSRYLVRFAADQHKFMMRMRQWQSTLVRSKMPLKDVDVDLDPESNAEEVASLVNGTHSSPNNTLNGSRRSKKDVEMTAEFIEKTYGEDASILTFCIEKHPTRGLGLTLVDGSVNGIKGVYVKSVAPDGDGKRKGLHMGDCILKLSDQSLCNKSRHDAVELVKLCQHEVHLEVLRFHSITAVLGPEGNTILPSSGIKGQSSVDGSTPSSVDARATKSRGLSRADDISSISSDKSRQTRTPPAQRKSQSSTSVLVQRRQRAVSDFGAIGDTLPKMNSDYLLASMDKIPQYKFSTRHSLRVNASDSSDDEVTETNNQRNYQPASIYNFQRDVEETSPTTNQKNNYESMNRQGGGHYQQRGKPSDTSKYTRSNGTSSKQKDNIDWTNDLADIRSDEESSSTNILTVQLNRIPGHTLGFRIATTETRAYIKQINSEPAISAGLQVNDRIISIDGQKVEGLNHQEVVNLLRTGNNAVRLVVERNSEPQSEGSTITVTLDKSQSSSLGLSLAKRQAQSGIFLRSLVPGSIAYEEGSLKVGDQLLYLNGEDIRDESPNAIVEKLQKIIGKFDIVVRRNELD